MLSYVSDARMAVRLEQKSKYLSDQIGISLTLCYVLTALGTRMKAMPTDTRSDFTPCNIIVEMATRTFSGKIFPACATVKATRRYELFVCFNFLHTYNSKFRLKDNFLQKRESFYSFK